MKRKDSIFYELVPRRFFNGILGILVLIAAWGAFSTWREFEALREIRIQALENGAGIQELGKAQFELGTKIANLEADLQLFTGPPQLGTGSWYGPGFHGLMTASGELYDSKGATAAHPSLPMGTQVLIINLKNGSRATAKINDRGPFVEGRIIDVSEGTAERLGMKEDGLALVLIIPIAVTMATARPGIQD